MEAARANGLTAPSALQPWYNMVEREKFEGALRDAALRHGLAVFPYYGLANGFLTGKYRSREDLDQSPRGLAQHRLSRRQGPSGARRARRRRRGNRRGARHDQPRLDDGAAGDHRRHRQRDERGAAGRAHRGDGADAHARANRAARTPPAPSPSSARPARPASSPRSRSRSPLRHRAPRTGCGATAAFARRRPPPPTCASGVPPTQKIRLSIDLSASQKRLKSSPPITAGVLIARVGAEMLLEQAQRAVRTTSRC